MNEMNFADCLFILFFVALCILFGISKKSIRNLRQLDLFHNSGSEDVKIQSNDINRFENMINRNSCDSNVSQFPNIVNSDMINDSIYNSSVIAQETIKDVDIPDMSNNSYAKSAEKVSLNNVIVLLNLTTGLLDFNQSLAKQHCQQFNNDNTIEPFRVQQA